MPTPPKSPNQWRKGQSGNPGGRPKSAGFPERVRQATRNGEDLIEIALEIMNDEAAGKTIRLDALKWLADRGWGRAVALVALESRPPEERPAFDRLTLQEQLELEALMVKAGQRTIEAGVEEETAALAVVDQEEDDDPREWDE